MRVTFDVVLGAPYFFDCTVKADLLVRIIVKPWNNVLIVGGEKPEIYIKYINIFFALVWFITIK